ncbi:ribonuclease domain-containing protein [Streptomyces sp. NPDC008092]|uniref:ribonuclease domain-containing protein n=1 Tax=Streptomyces sp. NPDC008092 TaxID=3364808 RepID=UPI0036E2DA7B
MQNTTWRTTVAAAVAAAAVTGGACVPATALARDPAHSAQQARPVAAPVAAAPVPQRAFDTLGLIDAGQWPPNDGSGTKGGSSWPNRDGTLPGTDHAGGPVAYLLWDVNRNRPGQARDPERIATGDDGSAWYSPDAGRTFTRMR